MKEIIASLMVLALLLTAGCGSSDDKPSKDTSIANPLSVDAKDCANVVNVLLNQRLHYKNDATENLMRKAALTVHGNPFPLNETDENFGKYSKAALRENLRRDFMHCSRFDDRRLSYTTADEIASAFADLIDTTTYEVTPSGKTVELDGEYQELNVHIEYPDIDAINRRALEELNAALKSKYGGGSMGDPDKIVAEKDRHGFEKLDRLLEYGYAFADHWTSSTQTPAQHAEFDAIVRDAYLSVLSDKNNLPIKTYNGTIHIAKRNAKGAVSYVFWDKDESLLPLNIDIWTPLAAPNEDLALDLGARDVLTLAVRDVRFDGSTMDVNIFVNNKTDEDIVLQYDVCDAYDKSLGWQWLSPNNQYIPLDGQEFVLAKGDGKTVDWKLQSGSMSGEPFMFRVRVMSRDFNGYIYAPLGSLKQ